jgi:hypothetical protein
MRMAATQLQTLDEAIHREQVTELACDLAEKFALGFPEERFENVDGTPDNALIKVTPSELGDLLEKAINAGAATELRRLANDVFIPAGSRDEVAVLLGRADELDGGTGR